jgi:uncharacterized protein YkwD
MHRHLLAIFVALASLLTLVACGGDGLGSRGAPSSSTPSAKGAGDQGQTEERVVYEKMPDGSVKKTTIRTTKRVVPAPDPPARPEDPYPSDPLVVYNVEQINKYRKTKGLGRVLYDAKISAFAKQGSERLSKDHEPHAHFAAHAKGAPGFGSRSAENQGDPAGVPSLDPDPIKNGKKQIDIMLKLMMDEGPGGGHYDNMMNPRFRRVGIGLVYAGARLYMTNDFSN